MFPFLSAVVKYYSFFSFIHQNYAKRIKRKKVSKQTLEQQSFTHFEHAINLF